VTRPASRETDHTVEEAPRRGREWIVPGIVVAGMLVGRLVFADLTAPAMLVFDGILPAVALGACLLVAGWCSGGAVSGPRSVARIALVVGLFGMFLHNMVTFSLWTPGVGLLFWTAGGACLAQAGGRSERTRKLVGALIAIAAVVAVGVVSVLFFGSAFVRMRHTASMLGGLRRGEIQRAVTEGAHAANADLWDPLAAADAAKVARLFAATRSSGRTEQTAYLSLGYNWAAASLARDPANSARHRLAANVAAEFARLGLPIEPTMTDALDHMMRAVELNPNDARLRVAYARMLLSAGRGGECAAQFDAAERIESQLLPGSIEKFKPLERREIEALRGEARAQ
jgi:hypothetical protein